MMKPMVDALSAEHPVKTSQQDWQPDAREKQRAVEKLGLLPWQADVYLHPARFRVVVAGRRSGKSFLCMHELYRAANSVAKGMVVYIAPTLKMAKQIMWRNLMDVVPPDMIDEINKTDMSIVLKGSGTMIRLFGAEVPDRLRGLSISFAVFDEAADITEEMWTKIVRPALADQRGDALFLGTPKVSAGSKWFYEAYCEGMDPGKPSWFSYTITTLNAGIVSKDEIEEARRTMAPFVFRTEMEASFESPTGKVYQPFQRSIHVVSYVDDDKKCNLHLGLDFNRFPMSGVMMVKFLDKEGEECFCVVDEVLMPNATIQRYADLLVEKYKGRNITIYPDASGNQQHTSAGGNTNHSVLRGLGFKLIMPRKNPAVSDRVNIVNGAFLSAAGKPRLFIHPRCKELITSLESLGFDDNGNIAKGGQAKYTHLPDALGYAVMNLMPITRRNIGSGVAKMTGGW
jgi:hypothetical protein